MFQTQILAMSRKGKGAQSHHLNSASNAAAAGDNGEYKWNSLKPMPTKRVFATAVDVDGQLHVLGKK